MLNYENTLEHKHFVTLSLTKAAKKTSTDSEMWWQIAVKVNIVALHVQTYILLCLFSSSFCLFSPFACYIFETNWMLLARAKRWRKNIGGSLRNVKINNSASALNRSRQIFKIKDDFWFTSHVDDWMKSSLPPMHIYYDNFYSGDFHDKC